MKYLNQNKPTNIVIILAGTNDCIRNVNSKTIAETVIGIHEEAKRRMKAAQISPAHTIAVTIPAFEGASDSRIEINHLIRQYAVQHSRETWVYEMENFSVPVEKYRDMWSPDNLHLTVKGYDKMGFELYEVIKRHFGRGDASYNKSNSLNIRRMYN